MRDTDDADVVTVLEEMRDCALGWVPEARIIGNIRAGDIARAASEALEELGEMNDNDGRNRKLAEVARDFPQNTCPASRHVQMLAEALAEGRPFPMLEEEPGHVAESLYSVLASLWAARTELARLKGETE